jgi:hypothetical protein
MSQGEQKDAVKHTGYMQATVHSKTDTDATTVRYQKVHFKGYSRTPPKY